MKRTLLLIAGFGMLIVGAIGVLVPVLPTTPFVLVSAGCFSATSPRMYAALRKNRFFGPYIESYRNGGGVPMAAKKRAVATLWIMLLFSMGITRILWVALVLLAVGTAVTLHILSLPSAQ